LIVQLKAERPDARVIVVASAPTPALRRKMAGLGVDTYLEKPALLPLLLQELLATLRHDTASTSESDRNSLAPQPPTPVVIKER
jgi:DNA-binding NarL/FixJ family response regulator